MTLALNSHIYVRQTLTDTSILHYIFCSQCNLDGTQLGVTRMTDVPGAPVFSLAWAPEVPADRAATSKGGPTLYCGMAAKEIRGWRANDSKLGDKVRYTLPIFIPFTQLSASPLLELAASTPNLHDCPHYKL